MSGADFLDTNVLVYAVDRDSPAKRGVAQTLVATALSRQTAVTSRRAGASPSTTA